MIEKGGSFLEILAGEGQGKQIYLGSDKPLLVGRNADCDLVIVNDPLISRKHARFVKEAGQAWVENLGSLNGVYVNRELIHAKCALKAGDEIIIGNHLFRYKDVSSTNSQAKRSSPQFAQPAPGNPNARPSPAINQQDQPVGPKIGAQDAVRRLSLFSQLTRAAVQSNEVDDLLRLILNLIFQDLRVHRGAVYLFNPSLQQWRGVCFKLRGTADEQAEFNPDPKLVNQAIAEGELRVFNASEVSASGLTLAIALPLKIGGQLTGLIYLDAHQKDFSAMKQDLDFLETLALYASTALEKAGLFEQSQRDRNVLERLEKHVGPEIVRMVKEKKVDIEKSDLETQEKEVAILFSDIAGFTSLSERLSAGEIAFLLNGYFNYMAECVDHYNGYLNKYIGDAVMAIFGAPFSFGNDSENAIRCALEMLEKLQVFWRSIDESKRFKIRIGINTGSVIAGNIGSLNRMEYTVIGDTVNLASRLESKAEPMSVLIGESTYRKVEGLFQANALGSLQVKGKKDPVNVYQIRP